MLAFFSGFIVCFAATYLKMAHNLTPSRSRSDDLVIQQQRKKSKMDDKDRLWVENTLHAALDSRDVPNGADFEKYIEKQKDVGKEKDIIKKFSDAVFSSDENNLLVSTPWLADNTTADSDRGYMGRQR
jgi:hypothetical protein